MSGLFWCVCGHPLALHLFDGKGERNRCLGHPAHGLRERLRLAAEGFDPDECRCPGFRMRETSSDVDIKGDYEGCTSS